MNTVGTPFLWSGFITVMAVMLIIDLFFQKHEDSTCNVDFKQAVSWCFIWIIFSLSFCAIFWLYLVLTTASFSIANFHLLSFLNGFLIEKALALDNVFVWIVLFNYFDISALNQRRILIYGIISAIILRAIMIFSGSYLFNRFVWLFYVFGIFLFFTGLKMISSREESINISENYLFKWLYIHLRIANVDNDYFFIRKNGLLYATQLLLVLILVELSDVIFAIDSIPAIFTVTTDPFIVLTSNLFAILGLRSIYFLLSSINIMRFSLILKYGLSMTLIFISIKMMIINFYRIPITVSLSVVLIILIVTLITNILVTRQSSKTNRE